MLGSSKSEATVRVDSRKTDNSVPHVILLMRCCCFVAAVVRSSFSGDIVPRIQSFEILYNSVSLIIHFLILIF